MNFRTEIQIEKSPIEIDYQQKIMMLGSCFTNSIGLQLCYNKFNVSLNPFGTLYNPASIEQAIRILMSKRVMTKDDLFTYNGLNHSFYHHGDYSKANLEETLSGINTSLSSARVFLNQTDILFITFGTSYVYEHIASKQVVSNCHKLPASYFERYRLSVEEIIASWKGLIIELQQLRPNLQIIFTVSPIRHLRDGAHDNQLSKSTLLLAIDSLCHELNNTHYFPAYEIVLDDLRDYRFYAEDMIHPNQSAINYIWKLFKNTYLSPKSCLIMKEWEKIKRALMHRPYNEHSNEHIEFLKQTLLKLKSLEDKYPYICLATEKTEINNRLR